MLLENTTMPKPISAVLVVMGLINRAKVLSLASPALGDKLLVPQKLYPLLNAEMIALQVSA